MSSSQSNSYNPFKSTHSFPIDLATALKSVDQAIFLHHINYWLELNERLKKNFHDARYWTYDKMEDLHGHFPFWTVKQLRLIIDKLVDLGILIKGNYNITKYDRTIWYSIDWQKVKCICPNGQMEFPERANPIAQKGRPIPDIIPDIIPDNEYVDVNAQAREKKPEIKMIEFGRFVKLTEEDHKKFVQAHGQNVTNEIIESINDYCANHKTGGYKDYAAAFRTFAKRDSRKIAESGESKSNFRGRSNHSQGGDKPSVNKGIFVDGELRT